MGTIPSTAGLIRLLERSISSSKSGKLISDFVKAGYSLTEVIKVNACQLVTEDNSQIFPPRTENTMVNTPVKVIDLREAAALMLWFFPVS